MFNKFSRITSACGSLIYLLPFLISLSNSQLLNRFNNLQEWAAREEQLFSLAKARIKRLQSELVELEGFVKDYEETTVRHLAGLKEDVSGKDEEFRVKVVASNALLIHRMSHRFATMVPRMQRTLLEPDQPGDELKEILGTFIDPNQQQNVPQQENGRQSDHLRLLPGEMDLDEAVTSLATLYDIYSTETNVKPHNFASRISQDTEQPVDISAHHAAKISLASFYQGMIGNAIDWIVYAQKRVVQEADYTISSDLVLYIREFMFKTHNEKIANPGEVARTALNLFEEPINDTIFEDDSLWQKRKIAQLAYPYENPDIRSYREDLAFYRLCTGEQVQTGRVKFNLKCFLDQTQHASFILSPLKVEQLSENPKIVQFHDVLNRNEIQEALEAVARTPLTPSATLDPNDYFKTLKRPPARTSADSWVDMHEFNKVVRKAEMVTGMDLIGKGSNSDSSSSGGVDTEEAHATEYVAGRYYYSHTDVLLESPDEPETAHLEGHDRLATLIFYLNEVEVGGEAAFCNVEAVASPVRGSAIYWENKYRNGMNRDDVWHGACPVIQGHKIILTVWFHYANQFTNFQCSLDRFE